MPILSSRFLINFQKRFCYYLLRPETWKLLRIILLGSKLEPISAWSDNKWIRRNRITLSAIRRIERAPPTEDGDSHNGSVAIGNDCIEISLAFSAPCIVSLKSEVENHRNYIWEFIYLGDAKWKRDNWCFVYRKMLTFIISAGNYPRIMWGLLVMIIKCFRMHLLCKRRVC